MIDFKSTSLTSEQVQYFDADGKLVCKYPYMDFLVWVDNKLWDLSEKEVEDRLDDIDECRKWTTNYYNHKNGLPLLAEPKKQYPIQSAINEYKQTLKR